jgi:hypothetical protein
VRFYWRGTCPPIGRGWVPLLRDLVGEWRRVRWLGGVLLAGSRAAGWVRFAHLYMCVVLCSYIYMSSLCVLAMSLRMYILRAGRGVLGLTLAGSPMPPATMPLGLGDATCPRRCRFSQRYRFLASCSDALSSLAFLSAIPGASFRSWREIKGLASPTSRALLDETLAGRSNTRPHPAAR